MLQFKNFFIYLLIISLLGCKVNYAPAPYKNNKEKKEAHKKISKYLNLSKDKFQKLKPHDSITFEILSSVNSKVDSKLINKRIDSFVNGSYSKKEVIYALHFERVMPGFGFEYDRTDKSKRYRENFKVNSTEEVKLLWDELISKLNKNLKEKNDSIRIKIDKKE